MALTADIGDLVILHGEFRVNVAGEIQLGDPTGNVCTVTVSQPDGTVVDVSGTQLRIDVGVYEATFTPSMAGDHWFRFQGEGSAEGAEESYFSVRKRRVAAP